MTTLSELTITTAPYYSLDGAISLQCDYAGHQKGKMRWLHGAEHLENGNDVAIDDGAFDANAQTFQLAISDVNPEEHAGEYSCELTLPNNDIITETTAVVVRRATVVDADYNAVSSSNVFSDEIKITCLSEALGGTEANKPISTKWYHGANPILEEANMVIHEGPTVVSVDGLVKTYWSSLTVKNSQFVSEGAYKCLFNFADNKDTEATVTTVYATAQSEDCVSMDYRTESKKTLKCTLTGGAAATKVIFTDSLGDDQDGVLASFIAGSDSSTPGTQVGSFTTGTISEVTTFTSTCTFTLASGENVFAKTNFFTGSKCTAFLLLLPLFTNSVI